MSGAIAPLSVGGPDRAVQEHVKFILSSVNVHGATFMAAQAELSRRANPLYSGKPQSSLK